MYVCFDFDIFFCVTQENHYKWTVAIVLFD